MIKLPLLATAVLAAATRLGAAEATPAAHPVVVELFTAQGCSTCPAADRLLTALGKDASVQVVPLAFHVDYWNNLGWIDPFSKPELTRRQDFYVRVLRAGSLYTPQAVIDGATELVGNQENEMRAAIASAAALPAAQVALRLSPAAETVVVDATVEVPESLRERKLDLMVALYETGLETPVKRGENGGKTLRDDYVVRLLKKAGRIEGTAGPQRLSATLSLGKDWRRANLGIAAFVQDVRAQSIHGAANARLAAD